MLKVRVNLRHSYLQDSAFLGLNTQYFDIYRGSMFCVLSRSGSRSKSRSKCRGWLELWGVS